MGNLHGGCKILASLLLLASGAALFAFGFGWLDGGTAHIVGGGALGLVGLAKLIHIFGGCPVCKAKTEH